MSNSYQSKYRVRLPISDKWPEHLSRFQMLQRTSEITFFAHRSLANSLTRDPCKLPYTGSAKLNGANAVSFVVTVKHVLENFDSL